MKRQITYIVAGAGFVAGCCLMQGCNSSKSGVVIDEPLLEFPPIIEEIPETKVETIRIAPVATTTAYTVKKGDTISGVAARYGLRWQDVVAVNPGISPNKLRIGQVIQLPGQVDTSKTSATRVTAPQTTVVPAPSRTETVYVVKSGDSLSVIAQKHGVKVDDIRKANNLTGDKILVNQKLKIPGATKSAATVAPSGTKATPPKVDAPKPQPKDTSKEPVVVPPPPAPVVEEVKTVVPTVEGKDAPVPATEGTYTVKAGEDLYAVAIRWGVSPSDLKALNNLPSSDLKEGMTLKIPSGGAQ